MSRANLLYHIPRLFDAETAYPEKAKEVVIVFVGQLLHVLHQLSQLDVDDGGQGDD